MSALQDSRARIIAAADAERRRLERDLHDGAQQRLVALSMQLGLAKRRLAKGEDAADLVEAADVELQAAIAELRDLARGIHPAVLTDRGLAPALRDLANRCAVPVELDAAARTSHCPSRSRRPPTSRSPRRSRTSPSTRRRARRTSRSARATACSRSGSPTTAWAARAPAAARACAASPTGSGRSAASSTSRARAGTARACPRPSRCARRSPSRSRRRRSRAPPGRRASARAGCSRPTSSSTRSVMALLVFIWLTTGAGYFWPQWAIAGWGFVLVLHAWFAQGRRRGMLAAETQPDR